MARIKELATTAGTLGCAIGIGFVMQSTESAEQRYGTGANQAKIPAAKELSLSSAMLEVEAITLTAATFDTDVELPSTDPQVTTVAAPGSVLAEPETPTAVAPGGPAVVSAEAACTIVADARPVAAAMVNVTLNAACLPNERLSIHHSGMIFTQVTSDTGALDITVPALSEDAFFVFAFGNGDGAVAQTVVEDLGDYSRVVLQWKGQSGFEIHARERGADYGEPGHIWRDAPGSIADAVTGKGGVLTRHGDMKSTEPLLAEVYSFPTGASAQPGDVVLSVETQVNTANCGLEIEAQAFELDTNGEIKTQNVTMSVPTCDSIGDFLVLNNLVADLKVASN
jgi:hypothetical protein